jgi:hypothetical protein
VDVAVTHQVGQEAAADLDAAQISRLEQLHALLSQDCTEPLNWDALLHTVTRRPDLLRRKPETLDDNVARSSGLLGLTKEQFLTAAQRHPNLFLQRPETLDANVTRSAGLLGIEKAEFLRAARTHPSLFYQRPDTLRRKLPYAHAIASALGTPMTTAELLARVPGVLMYSTKHLHLRYILAQTGNATALTSVVVMPSAKAEALAVEHFRGNARTLQVMHAKGLIRRLPDGAGPLARD